MTGYRLERGKARRRLRPWWFSAGIAPLFMAAACESQVPPTREGVLPSGVPAPSLELPPEVGGADLLHETERDWAIARGTVAWARGIGLLNRPIGEAVAVIATSFVGTPYAPGTLEIPGPEGLVVNLRTFDCVTLVEHVLVLARLTVAGDDGFLDEETAFRDRYRSELTTVRYRGGVLSGYQSRLHYFSEWIRDGGAKGLIRPISESLGGIRDPRPIHFMSDHPESYRQISEDPAVLAEIARMEEGLTAEPRFYIPEDRIADLSAGIQDGDIIAAVSSLDGLDVAHTGIALWQGDQLHLLHAPLVGDSVEVSELPLADRIQGFSSQMGVMVARPIQP